MTDEKYAVHVRAEMYKRTHQHLLEEKRRRGKAENEKRRKAKKKQTRLANEARLADEARKVESESEAFRRQVEESLRRKRERKDRVDRAQGWNQKWMVYQGLWETFKGNTTGTPRIAWPVRSGKGEDLEKEKIEEFFLNKPTADQADLVKTLKLERVRWHPDKFQQKIGGHGVEKAQMRDVTAVFQIIDSMWNEMKNRE